MSSAGIRQRPFFATVLGDEVSARSPGYFQTATGVGIVLGALLTLLVGAAWAGTPQWSDFAGADSGVATRCWNPLPLLQPIFSDHAVLQRGEPIHLWGWTDPGEAVKVSLSGNKLAHPATAATTGDPTGLWQVDLPEQPVGGPYSLSVTSGARHTRAVDLLVGDVWVCSGQSNMELPLIACQDGQQEVAKASYPNLRLCKVPFADNVDPQQTAPLTWQPCTPESARNFSGAAYYMGLKLTQDLHVPIGLVESAVGGTMAEAWMSLDSLLADPRVNNPFIARSDHEGDLDALLGMFARVRWQDQESHGASWEPLYRAWMEANEPGHKAKPPWYDPTFDDHAWMTMKLPGIWGGADHLPHFAGVVWFRKTVVLDNTWGTGEAAITVGSPKDHDTVWVNGEQVGDDLAQGSWDRTYRLRPGLLHAGANTIAIRISGYTGRYCGIGRVSRQTPPPSEMHLDQGKQHMDLEGDWLYQPSVDFSKAPPPPVRIEDPDTPTVLYNAMIAPLFPLRIKGIAWYQGEYSTWSGLYYRQTLSELIADWRTRFGQGNLPFLVVQLPNIGDPKPDQPEAGNDGWVLVREAQRLTATTVPDVGLVVTTDIGAAHSLHPPDKRDLGNRLAGAAMALAYQQKGEWSGPLYRDAVVEGDHIRIHFDDTGAGLRTTDGKPLSGFAIAGDDQHFVWAQAVVAGNDVTVGSPQVPHPVAVRYNWATNPIGNLTNNTGLPASPFRTDNWPMPEKSW